MHSAWTSSFKFYAAPKPQFLCIVAAPPPPRRLAMSRRNPRVVIGGSNRRAARRADAFDPQQPSLLLNKSESKASLMTSSSTRSLLQDELPGREGRRMLLASAADKMQLEPSHSEASLPPRGRSIGPRATRRTLDPLSSDKMPESKPSSTASLASTKSLDGPQEAAMQQMRDFFSRRPLEQLRNAFRNADRDKSGVCPLSALPTPPMPCPTPSHAFTPMPFAPYPASSPPYARRAGPRRVPAGGAGHERRPDRPAGEGGLPGSP